MEYREDSQIRGVILNQISPNDVSAVKADHRRDPAGESATGMCPMVTDCVLESRHLGLVTAGRDRRSA